jgi:hypothetical protein
VRVWFGPAIDYGSFLDVPATAATYRRLAELVMERIAELAELDRAQQKVPPSVQVR